MQTNKQTNKKSKHEVTSVISVVKMADIVPHVFSHLEDSFDLFLKLSEYE